MQVLLHVALLSKLDKEGEPWLCSWVLGDDKDEVYCVTWGWACCGLYGMIVVASLSQSVSQYICM